LQLFSFGGFGLVLAALALVVFGAYDSYPTLLCIFMSLVNFLGTQRRDPDTSDRQHVSAPTKSAGCRPRGRINHYRAGHTNSDAASAARNSPTVRR